jgi:acyl-coenzyme A thioesterase PaaI-like protein
MSPDQIPALLRQMVPFIETVGLTIDEVGPGTAVARLASRPEVHNHIGTVHAGALYTVGESATGAVVLGLFGDKLPGVFIALKSATVAHTKARPGDLVAHAAVVGDAKAIRKGYDADGKADFDVAVRFEVEGTEVAQVTYTWAVRAPRS